MLWVKGTNGTPVEQAEFGMVYGKIVENIQMLYNNVKVYGL